MVGLLVNSVINEFLALWATERKNLTGEAGH